MDGPRLRDHGADDVGGSRTARVAHEADSVITNGAATGRVGLSIDVHRQAVRAVRVVVGDELPDERVPVPVFTVAERTFAYAVEAAANPRAATATATDAERAYSRVDRLSRPLGRQV